ncbi:MAG: methyl-accepting chemotaxis protein, partial [Coleofasciculaceae cyanobacterium]
MTQTPPKNTPQNSTNNSSQSRENFQFGGQTSRISYSSSSPRQLYSPGNFTPPSPKRRGFRWQALSLRVKATIIAVAIATIPVLTVGGVAYQFASSSVKKQINQVQLSRAQALAEQFHKFLLENYREVELLSSNQLFTDAELWQNTSLEQKKAVLDQFQSALDFYDNIAFFDLEGNTLFQSDSARPVESNYSDRPYYQQALQTGEIVFNELKISKSSGQLSIELAAPVQQNGKLIGIVRTRIPGNNLEKIFENFDQSNGTWHLINSEGTILATNNPSHLSQQAEEMLPKWKQLLSAEQSDSELYSNSLEGGEKFLATYVPIRVLEGLTEVKAGALLTIPAKTVFASQVQLLRIIVLGTGVVVLLVGGVAAIVAYRVTNPVVAAATAVEKIGQGELDTRLSVAGEDEVAVLGTNINSMARQLKDFLESQKSESERTRLIKDITLHLFQSLEQEEIFNRITKDIREALKVDRVVVYLFDENWKGTIITESVAEGWPKALGAQIKDPCFAERYVDKYKQGRVQATPDIYQAGLTECHLQQLEPFAVKANLVAPILRGNQLLGLLIGHQCSGPRNWQNPEIDLFSQLAIQVGLALDRAGIEEQRITAQQQRIAKEQLQERAMELIREVEPISEGDLTIQARVTADEIGTIADFYNLTIRNLRRVVTQVQSAAQKVATTTSGNQVSMQNLSAQAQAQAEEIAEALGQVQVMGELVQLVAHKAEQAEAVVQQTAQTVQEGDAAMSRTVEGILTIRETVAGTRQKVKRLGESSQKISAVINLINGFSEQSHLLALNASIEAARAGEEGRGFAVVAEQVRKLARQSAAATQEIEKLVGQIQAETNEVVVAMEAGTEQVVTGTQLV